MVTDGKSATSGIIPKDGDNAPKRRRIKDFVILSFQYHWQEFEQIMESNFKFIRVGKDTIEDKEALKLLLMNAITRLDKS